MAKTHVQKDAKISETNKTIYPKLYMLALTIIFAIAFTYIFNEKLDLNGDNCEYYMLSTSIATGQGYSNLMNAVITPSATFPPGYPLLMSPVRFFTSSFVAQKLLNGLFLLGSALLLFLFIRRFKLPDSLAFVACVPVLLNSRVLHFSTMMMSEMSYLFFSVLVIWALYKIDYNKPFWKDKWFYLLIFTAAYAYHIRTQGIALAAGAICFFLITRKWKQTLGFTAGYILCLLPWMIRNKVTGVGQSRYLDQILGANAHRPEEGTLGIGEIIERFFETSKMLITKAIPNTIMPYFSVDYSVATTIQEWLIAIIVIAIVVIGFAKFGKLKYFFYFYIIATLGVISLFNDPGENRYITTIVPLLEVGLLIGVYAIIEFLFKKMKLGVSFSPFFLILLFVLFSFSPVKALHKVNKQPFPPAYQNFFKIAEEVNKKLPSNVIVSCRKPGLFYAYAKTYVCAYKWTPDDMELIKGLVDSNADYVMLEQLGYSSTFRYLYPAIQKNPELFEAVMFLPNPETYLLKFDKVKAAEKIKQHQSGVTVESSAQ